MTADHRSGGVMTLRPEVRMGNDIARQFAHLTEDKAAAAIAAHLRTFWDPRMRQALCRAVADGDEDADPLLRAAVTRL
jgi:formate dehydrogenase subunit delta